MALRGGRASTATSFAAPGRRLLRHLRLPRRRAAAPTSATASGWPSCSTGRPSPSRTSPSSSSAASSTTSCARRGERVTVVGATSGDTGSAAIEALRDRDAVDVFILHPAGRVSEVQRRQMTTVDCAQRPQRRRRGHLRRLPGPGEGAVRRRRLPRPPHLSAVNSHQLGPGDGPDRLLRHQRGRGLGGRDGRPVAFSVPTGNFGNVFAGYGAQRMGTPDLASSSWRRTATTSSPASSPPATMTIGEVHPTLSPSMDIQVSSNLERLLFELYGRDGAAIAELMAAVPGRGHGVGRRRSPRPAGRALVGRPGRRRRHARHHRRRSTSARRASSTRTPPSAWRAAREARPTRACRWSCWPRPTRPSSPTRSRRPPASARRCPPTSPTCFERPERYEAVANDLDGRARPHRIHPRRRPAERGAGPRSGHESAA